MTRYELGHCKVHGLTEFAKYVSNYTWQCLLCRKEYHRAWKLAQKEKERIRLKEYKVE